MDHSEIERLQHMIDRSSRSSGVIGFATGSVAVLSIGLAFCCSVTYGLPASLIPIAVALGLSCLYGSYAAESRANLSEMEWHMAEIRSIQAELDGLNRLRGM